MHKNMISLIKVNIKEIKRVREDIIERLSKISDTERSATADGYSHIFDAESAFANMRPRRRDYMFNVTDSSKTVGARLHTRFVDIPIHSHNYIEMMYVLTGEVIHIIDGEEFAVKEGSLIFMNRHLRHAIRASNEGDLAVNFIISSDYLSIAASRFRNDPSLRDFSEQERDDKGEGRFLIYDIGDCPCALSLMENLIFEILFESDTPKGIIRDTLSLLIRHLEAKPSCLSYSSSGEHDRDPLRSKIYSYIQNSYRAASLSELSSALGMSMPYVSRRVKELFGASFTELVRERRFSEAEQLLLHSDVPVTAIAEAVGYENNSFFHRRFREQYGISPSKWRKDNKNRTSV